ncbi:MAG: metallopeptidase TldD-related protein [Candidatus Sericytochromatia bacterium]|nr:metallopeptidase TldD-related protein [Candidatus Sericytochromatia bacterium]
MTYAERLVARLTARAANPIRPELALTGWRLLLDTSTRVEIGLKDNQTGGPYDAPNRVTGTRGDVYLRWADGRISVGVVDRATLEALDDDLAAWRAASYEDPWAPEVLGPQVPPEVVLFDSDAAAWVDGDPAPLFEVLDRFRQELPAYGAERVSGAVGASVASRVLVSSEGLFFQGNSTSVGLWADIDSRAADGLSLRRPPRTTELDDCIRRTGELARALSRDAELRAGRQTVVFWPSATEAMLGKYLFGNLDGQRVLNRGAAFTLSQFEAQEAVFHPDFQVGVDPTRALAPGAYAVTAEGVPARPWTFVSGGKLLTPVLDLKHARKAGSPPTCFPRGASSYVLPEPESDLETLIAGIDRGLLVVQMLGLHTQDTASGRFSLTVAQGLVIEGGVLRGRAKAIIAGNMLAAWQEPVRWARVPGKDAPAMVIEADVTPG